MGNPEGPAETKLDTTKLELDAEALRGALSVAAETTIQKGVEDLVERIKKSYENPSDGDFNEMQFARSTFLDDISKKMRQAAIAHIWSTLAQFKLPEEERKDIEGVKRALEANS